MDVVFDRCPNPLTKFSDLWRAKVAKVAKEMWNVMGTCGNNSNCGTIKAIDKKTSSKV